MINVTLSRTSLFSAFSPRTRAFSCCSFHNRCLSHTYASTRSCSTIASSAASPYTNALLSGSFHLSFSLLVDLLLSSQVVLPDDTVMWWNYTDREQSQLWLNINAHLQSSHFPSNHSLGFVWRSRRGSSGTGNFAIRWARNFSSSNAAFLNERKIKLISFVKNSSSVEQTDEEDEDSVHFHFASYHCEVYLMLVDLVLQHEHHFLMSSSAIVLHNQATIRSNRYQQQLHQQQREMLLDQLLLCDLCPFPWDSHETDIRDYHASRSSLEPTRPDQKRNRKLRVKM